MTVTRFLLPCRATVEGRGLSDGRPQDGVSPDFTIVGPVGPSDWETVAVLAEACLSFPTGDEGPLLSPAGLVAELVGRPGRRVQAWLARRHPRLQSSDRSQAFDRWNAVDDRCPLGMVALVEIRRGQQVRSSIARLLVHPAVRRRGVASALVGRAVAHARGQEIWAETLSSWPTAVAFWRSLAAAEAGATSPAGQSAAKAGVQPTADGLRRQ